MAEAHDSVKGHLCDLLWSQNSLGHAEGLSSTEAEEHSPIHLEVSHPIH